MLKNRDEKPKKYAWLKLSMEFLRNFPETNPTLGSNELTWKHEKWRLT